MNAGRIILATVLGGIAMFFWSFLAHMALPIGDMGVQSLPSDQTLVHQMQQAIKQRGFYFFPGMDKQNMSEEAKKAWMERYKQGPRGVLIYDPSGGEMMSAGQLGTEFLSNVAAALLMALVLAQVRANMLMRTLLGAAMGVFAWASLQVSYWNWYRFPGDFTFGGLLEQGIGGLVTGLVVAAALGGVRQARESDLF